MDDYLKKNYDKITKYFAATYFNKTWDILDNTERTKEDIEKMKHLCHSSFQHWTEVENCTEENLSIGYWQLSRVYSVAGEGENAIRYANKCIEISENAELAPFYIAYAYEAKARALKILGKFEESSAVKNIAEEFVPKIKDKDSKKLIEKDLEDI
jgi:tetratricopeptide (TPR) repeat protein